MADEQQNGSSRFLRNGFSLGNILTMFVIAGGVLAVYVEIRSSQAVEDDRVTALTLQLAADRLNNQSFASEMRNQLTQISKDLSWLEGTISVKPGKPR